jgi:hypothetical protein
MPHMSYKTLPLKIHKEDVCEALNCTATATKWISAQAGQHGTVCLHLCKDCVPKFKEEVKI